MKKTYTFLFIAFLLLSACTTTDNSGSSTTDTTVVPDTVVVDSVPAPVVDTTADTIQ